MKIVITAGFFFVCVMNAIQYVMVRLWAVTVTAMLLLLVQVLKIVTMNDDDDHVMKSLYQCWCGDGRFKLQSHCDDDDNDNW